MAITSILRNFNGSPSMVFIQSDNTLAELTTDQYLTLEQPTIDALNNGPFTFNADDYCLINYADGEGFFKLDLTDNKFVSATSAGEVILPVTVNNVALFADAEGTIKNGAAPSNPALPTVIFAQPPFGIGNLPKVGDTNGSLEDSGLVAENVLYGSVVNPNVASNLFWVKKLVPFSALSGGATANILTAMSGSATYSIREIYLNSDGAPFVGGDRDAIIYTDLTTLSTIPTASLLGAAVNTRWGSTDLTFPPAAAIDFISAAGASFGVKYSGGTTDYTNGQLIIDVLFERIV